MNKKIILWFLAGWLLSLVFSPTHLTGAFTSAKSSSGS
jgi:hypothetical protein